MTFSIPSQASQLANSLIGRRIIRVRRYVLRSDYDILPRVARDEESDGPVELALDDGRFISVVSDTESMSVEVAALSLPVFGDSYVYINPGDNIYWSERLHREINAVALLRSRHASNAYPSEFGFELGLGDGLRVLCEYISDEEHTDTLRLRSEYSGPECERVILAEEPA